MVFNQFNLETISNHRGDLLLAILVVVITIFGLKAWREIRKLDRLGWPTEGKTSSEIYKMLRQKHRLAGFVKGNPTDRAILEKLHEAYKEALKREGTSSYSPVQPGTRPR